MGGALLYFSELGISILCLPLITCAPPYHMCAPPIICVPPPYPLSHVCPPPPITCAPPITYMYPPLSHVCPPPHHMWDVGSTTQLDTYSTTHACCPHQHRIAQHMCALPASAHGLLI